MTLLQTGLLVLLTMLIYVQYVWSTESYTGLTKTVLASGLSGLLCTAASPRASPSQQKDAPRPLRSSRRRAPPMAPVAAADGLVIMGLELSVFGAVSRMLTEHENYRTQSAHEAAYVSKMFFFIFVDGYLWYWVLGFVHIPLIMHYGNADGTMPAELAEQTSVLSDPNPA